MTETVSAVSVQGERNMIRERNKKLAFGAFALALVLVVQTIPPTHTSASDHIDSPIITQDRGSDLADTYAFLDSVETSESLS